MAYKVHFGSILNNKPISENKRKKIEEEQKKRILEALCIIMTTLNSFLELLVMF